MGLAFVLATPASAALDLPREYDLKAALLYNFTQFVQWPPQAFASDTAPLVIGVIGRDPFGASLDRIVQGEHAGSHPIVVRRCSNDDEASRCHILFVSASERAEASRLLARISGKPVLTVADFEGFLRDGGMVVLQKNADHRIRLRVNYPAAKTARLTMSAKLLRVAELFPEK